MWDFDSQVEEFLSINCSLKANIFLMIFTFSYLYFWVKSATSESDSYLNDSFGQYETSVMSYIFKL